MSTRVVQSDRQRKAIFASMRQRKQGFLNRSYTRFKAVAVRSYKRYPYLWETGLAGAVTLATLPLYLRIIRHTKLQPFVVRNLAFSKGRRVRNFLIRNALFLGSYTAGDEVARRSLFGKEYPVPPLGPSLLGGTIGQIAAESYIRKGLLRVPRGPLATSSFRYLASKYLGRIFRRF